MLNRPQGDSALIFLTLCLMICLTLIAAGCAKQSAPPVTEPPQINGYLELKEEFGDLDFSPLQGRKILIDPGHGGFFRGATGPEGLSEAEVNLGVALYLRGLLEWAGCQAHLTRSADYDFLSPADSTLAADLAFRSSITDSLQPDVFISIHHNSTASRDPEINETQTYYPLGDDGASLDLARSIHRHLVINLGISPAKILPGNFHVLRKATVPAVLGEPAMISNPVMEGRLSLAASHELEAQAYFLGLLDYFAGGQPRWSGAAADTLLTAPLGPAGGLSRVFLPASKLDPAAPGPDPSSFSVTLDGVSQAFDLSADGRTVTWFPESPLPGPSHHLQFHGRNLKGRAAPVAETVLQVITPTSLQVTLQKDSAPDGSGARTLLHWHTRDGRPAPPGFLVADNGMRLMVPPLHRGWFLLPEEHSQQTGFHFENRTDQQPLPVDLELAKPLPAPWQWRLISQGENPHFGASRLPAQRWRRRWAQSPQMTADGIDGSPAVAWTRGIPVWIEARGFLPLVHPGDRPDRQSTFAVEAEIWRPRMLLPDLNGKVIILDAAGGGTVTDGTYPLGSRGADLNLECARQTQRALEGAGATVWLTRQDEVAPDPQQKILLAGRKEADLFLTIGRAPVGAKGSVYHHPGSRVGQIWARAMVAAAAGLDSLQTDESYAYLLRHTACPALEVRWSAPVDADDELVLSSQPWLQAESRALLLACAAALSVDGRLPATVDALQALAQLKQGLPLDEIQWARWDGNFFWQPLPLPAGFEPVSSWHLPGWPADGKIHTLEIHTRNQMQLWRVELTPDHWQFDLMMESR